MRLRLFIRRPTLRKKLIVTSVACLVLPAVFMLYTTSVYSQRIIREQTLENAAQSLNIVQTQINAIFDEMVSTANLIHFDAELKSLLEDAKANPQAGRRLTERLEQISAEKHDLYLTLLLNDGRAFSDYSFYDFKPALFFQQPWFEQVTKMSNYDTLFLGAEPNYLASQKQKQGHVFMLARAMMDEPSKPYAYLIISRAENTIRNLFAGFAQDIYLLDDQNRILSNKDQNKIGQLFQSTVPSADLSSERVTHLDDQNQLYISVPLRYAGWKLVSVASYEQLTSKLTEIYHSELLLQMLFVACFLIALTYLLRKFTKPVQVLGDVAKKVKAGELGIRSHIRGGDEIGQLGWSFDHMLDQIELMIEQMQVEQELKRQAEFALLQAQVHPHFLFNVLGSIRIKLMMKGDNENAELILSLSSLLRSAISNSRKFVTLHEEIESVKQYIELMNIAIRHPIDAVIHVNIDPFLETVPRFILQPVIENAYKHGFALHGGSISILAEKTDMGLRIVIEDNGLGMEPEALNHLCLRLQLKKWQIVAQSSNKEQASSSGIGLANVYERLKLIYGDRFEMKIASEPGQGTSVELIIPINIQ